MQDEKISYFLLRCRYNSIPLRSTLSLILGKYLNFQKALGLTYNVLEFENRPEFQYSKNNLLVFETKILVVKYLKLRIFLDKNLLSIQLLSFYLDRKSSKNFHA